MRLLIAAFALTVTCWGAASAAENAGAAETTLKVGDSAPALKVTTWLHGAPVKSFEPGNTYVVEFWATWCGPCLQMMPHMGDLQEEYRGKGLSIIGFTCESTDKEDKVVKFVEKRGAKLGYTFAFSRDSETSDAYMKASGQQGIPCCFVVNKQGKIAYIGHPMFLDLVLPKVLNGAWEAKAGEEEIAAAEKDLDSVFASLEKKDKPEVALKALDSFASRWPRMANNPLLAQVKLELLVQSRETDAVKGLVEKQIARAKARGDTFGLVRISTFLRGSAAKEQPGLLSLSVAAARTAYDQDEKSGSVLLNLVEAYRSAGDEARVKEFGPKAVAAAVAAVEGDKDILGTLRVAAAQSAAGEKEKAKETAEKALGMVDGKSPGLKQYVEREAKKYGAEPKK